MNSVVLTIVLAAPIVLLGSSPKCENLGSIALPNITIISAGMAPTGDSAGSVNDRQWLKQLYASGLPTGDASFAIGAHRAKRAKAIGQSPLDEIAGIGARRKHALLHHFGSARAVARAGLAEIERVGGISKAIAKKVYDHFHADG